MKKILALLLATLMVLSMGAVAFAAADSSVSVTNLMKDDTVKLYQVLKWGGEAGWILAPGFEGLVDKDPFKTNIPATADTAEKKAAAVVDQIVDGITLAEAKAISSLAAGATAVDTKTVTGTDYTYGTTGTATDVTAKLGLYMAVVTAGQPNYIYNPIFVSADFKDENSTTHTISSSATYTDSAVAKKTKDIVDKTTEDSDSAIESAIDSYVGQEVDFHVDTTVPVYLDSYKNPTFVINDVIETNGIELVAGSVKVKLDGNETASGTEFTLVENGKKGYTVTFAENFLKSNVAPVAVRIDYKGKITNQAKFNVNQDNNTVTVTYSNGPDEETGALRDRTNHYTFSIGADIFGKEGEKGKTYELVKVGADAQGNPIVEKKLVSSWSSESERHPLAGAEFGLYTDADCTTLYTNDLYPNGATFTTLADGVITFKGLAAGTYYLSEINAPAGYLKDSRKVKVEIEAVYKNVMVPSAVEGKINVAAYEVKVLDYYTVTVNGASVYMGGSYVDATNPVQTKYTYDNEGPTIIASPTVEFKDSDLINTPGVELPSTGGIGTTIFYVAGSIMVLAAAILLVTKRRMSAGE